MNHFKALGIKWIIVGIVTFSLFGIFNHVPIALLFSISVTVALLSYLIGDLILLPRLGNLLASLADFGLTSGLFLLLSNGLIQVSLPTTLASLAAAFFITCTEPLFHTYLEERIFPSVGNQLPLNNLQTEFAEESDPDIDSDQEK